MAKFTEEVLISWTKPPSNTEQFKLKNAERMVKEAIDNDQKFKFKSIEIFAQGSYANNTNVKLNSDIDINVRYMDAFYYDLPEGKDKNDFSIVELNSYSYMEFKNDVEKALCDKFGKERVKRKDKCITVQANSYIIETDVVPTWENRRYDDSGSYVLGAIFYSDKGKKVINYPKQHISNGIQKNTDTARRFKRLTRLHRKLRYKMIEDNIAVSDAITSFLLECLVWNIPNNIFNENNSWNDTLRNSIIHLYNKTKEKSDCDEWGEVSDLLYLFRGGKKWCCKDVNEYMLQLWQYLEYK